MKKRLRRSSTLAPFALAVALALLLGPAPAVLASEPENVTAEERALWPPYCNHTNGKPGYDAMFARYGTGWAHMHHYCWAFIDSLRLNRSPSLKSHVKGHGRALGNLDYVLTRTTPQFVFRKDVLMLKIRLVERYESRADAIKLAAQLVAESPDFADGYAALAALLIRSGRRDEARRVLASGAEMVSDKERFERLKGTLDLR